MKAFILAAGTGTRLQPLTFDRPKALIQIGNYCLLEIIIKQLASCGVKDLAINVHHFSGQIIDFLRSKNSFGLNIFISDESDELLDTGGAIKKASSLFRDEDTILVHNVDILTNLNYNTLVSFHETQGALITLAVKNRPTSRSLLIDSSHQLRGWEFPDKKLSILTQDNRKGLQATAFSGVYALSTKAFDKFPQESTFSLIPWLLNLASHEKILTWDQSPAFWYEVGRLESVALANRSLIIDEKNPDFITEIC